MLDFLSRDFALDATRRAQHQAVVGNVLALGNQGIGADDAVASDAGAIEHHGLDADQAVGADGAAVQHGLVADSDADADVELIAGIGVQYAPILDVGTCADVQILHIATYHRIEPDPHIFTES